MTDSSDAMRYARHLALGPVGVAGQRRLREARVAVVGLGGLGSPVALYLAAAGIGTLVVVDPDRVDLSNLQRQILHDTPGVGRSKVESGVEHLERLNPGVRVEGHSQRLTAENAVSLMRGCDVAVDCTDNFPARYIVNEACVRLGLPLVYGAVHEFEGQASVLGAPGPCYRCLFPEAPPEGAAPNCSEAGVLGVMPGLIGMVQATETLKLILGLGDVLRGRLLLVDALGMVFRTVGVKRDGRCPTCAAPAAVDAPWPDYGAPPACAVGGRELSAHELRERPGLTLVDVREAAELEHEPPLAGARHVPLGELAGRFGELEDLRRSEFVVYCRSGARSARACAALRSEGFDGALNLKGGWLAWRAEGNQE